MWCYLLAQIINLRHVLMLSDNVNEGVVYSLGCNPYSSFISDVIFIYLELFFSRVMSIPKFVIANNITSNFS